MTAYDLTRLTPAGVQRSHHAGKVEIDGPWLIMHSPGDDGSLDLIVPAHAVVAVEPCTAAQGRCPDGREQ